MGSGRELDVCGDSTLRAPAVSGIRADCPGPPPHYSAREAGTMPLFLYRCATTGYRAGLLRNKYLRILMSQCCASFASRCTS